MPMPPAPARSTPPDETPSGRPQVFEDDPRLMYRAVLYEHLRAVLEEENPSPETAGAAAKSLHDFFVMCLEYAGWGRQPAKVIAEMLDESPSNYSKARSGRISPQRLLTWIGKWTVLSSYGSEIAIPLHICSPTSDTPPWSKNFTYGRLQAHPSYRPIPRVTNVEQAYAWGLLTLEDVVSSLEDKTPLQETAQPSENTPPPQKNEQPSIPSRVELENGDVYEGRLYLVKRGE